MDFIIKSVILGYLQVGEQREKLSYADVCLVFAMVVMAQDNPEDVLHNSGKSLLAPHFLCCCAKH